MIRPDFFNKIRFSKNYYFLSGYLKNIRSNIRVTALSVNLDYPLFQDNACDGIINMYCPLVKDENVEYKYTMHILNVFPEVSFH
ncbi:hypothetical protein NQ314_021250 [Rhamnusium bicolor]|uniref:MD-2-related lipid-recognition domain-containing protein n=1 Tax=Rhamnusium bicolor TaxID=1586634 RepID=A0AAV8WJT0_9CUCU|nr:hypothetical protein NQ314_021250 [Rhamnusium bicolor]